MTYPLRHVTKRIGQSIAYRLFRLAVHLTLGHKKTGKETRMKRRITRLTVLQTGKLLAALYGFLSIVILPFLLIAMLFGGARAIAPMLVMLVMLVLYPILGFILGVIMAALYNLASKWIGGLEVTVEAVEGE
jgi:hypothetical protein